MPLSFPLRLPTDDSRARCKSNLACNGKKMVWPNITVDFGDQFWTGSIANELSNFCIG